MVPRDRMVDSLKVPEKRNAELLVRRLALGHPAETLFNGFV